jgi:hypothetical protein
MGSSAYREELPPQQFREIIDEAIERGDSFIVSEAHGASRAFQRYLHSKSAKNVIVGHARSIRFNIGGWQTRKYGDTLSEREKALIDDCNYALIIWVNRSGVIAKNLEYLKRTHKPAFVFETYTMKSQQNFYALD